MERIKQVESLLWDVYGSEYAEEIEDLEYILRELKRVTPQKRTLTVRVGDEKTPILDYHRNEKTIYLYPPYDPSKLTQLQLSRLREFVESPSVYITEVAVESLESITE